MIKPISLSSQKIAAMVRTYTNSGKNAAQIALDMSSALGIDIQTAQQRLSMAKMTKGVNVNRPQYMIKALMGEYETAPVQHKSKSYIYKQKKYEKDNAGAYGIVYADTFLKKRKI